MSAELFPVFLRLAGRDVLVVGGGAMAAARARQLAAAGARVTVVAPEIGEDAAASAVAVRRRAFEPADLDGAWFAVAAATPEVNRSVSEAAESRRVLLNAVDDPERASAYTAGVVRRGGVTIAVSTDGRAPALAGLLREAIDSVIPADIGRWVKTAERERVAWKRAAVPLATRRPMLLRKLNALYEGGATSSSTPAGLVSLVGAGPGDPALLTRRALDRLAVADVVLYDALTDTAVLKLAPSAHCFSVGKRAGRPSVSQSAIERLLVKAARRGKRVVRLKCGDPFVFGRGGEEALALAAAGVPFEVVPGVSSVIAAPALAGIPVTHRGLSAGFAVVSGHAEATYAPVLDGLAPASMTLLVVMGIAARRRIAERLLGRGWEAATPTAILLGASSPQSFTWRGSLGELRDSVIPADRAHLPGTLVIGAVAALELADGKNLTLSAVAANA
jgi:uroporphyrin-III C-methyltransferase/precorrin-2 dehydrogenase/sirohydrochlorin ferrochelatase